MLITYFSSKLQKQDEIQLDTEQLEIWCSNIVQSYFSTESENEMYIGFCYQTILDGNYSDEYRVPGSTTLLLLALTRGLEELCKNNTRGNNHQPVSITNDSSDQEENNFKIARWLPFVFKTEENPSNLNEIPFEDQYKLQEIKESQVIDKKFLGATSRGIIIKKQFPSVVRIVFVIGIISFNVYAGFIIAGTNLKSRVQVFRMLGTFVEVLSSGISIALLLLKVRLLSKWELNDMLRDRIRTRSLTELYAAISPNRMVKMARAMKRLVHEMLRGCKPTESLTEICKSIRPNRNEKKAKAIKLLASIPNPKNVFSWNYSCAFVDEGCGEFEIDEDITIEDLRNAGYRFGVNYYGQPIVADTRAQVRCVEFPNEEKETVHISGLHEWQPRYMFELPTNNLTVAGTNSSSPFSETVADSV